MKNKLHLSIICLFVIFSINGFAQTSQIDSLNAVIASTKIDTNRLNSLLQLAKIHNTQSEYKQAVSYAKEAENIALERGEHTYLGDIYSSLSSIYLKAQIIDSSLYFEFKATRIYDSLNETKKLATALKNIGVAHYYQDSLYQSLEFSKKALEKYKIVGDTHNIIRCNSNISVAYNYLSNFTEAIRYLLDGLKLADKGIPNQEKAKLYNNLASIYMGQRNFEVALPNLLKAKELYQNSTNERGKLSNLVNLGATYHELGILDSSIYYHKIVIKKAEELGFTKKLIYAYINLSAVYDQTGELEKAMECARHALTLTDQPEYSYEKSSALYVLALVMHKMKRYNEAIEYLKVGISLDEKNHRTVEIAQGTKHLHDNYSKIGNYKLAYETLLKYNTVQDSIFNDKNTKTQTKLEVEYEYFKREQQLTLETKEKQYQKDLIIKTQKSQRNLALIILAFISILSFLTFYLFRVKQQKKEHKLKEALYMNMQQTLCQQMNPHFIFNTLNSIQSVVLKNNSKESVLYISDFAYLMRKMLHNSQSYLIPLEDELEVLKTYSKLEKIRFDNKFSFEVEVSDDIDSSKLKIPVFLLQPLIENAIKHGIEPSEKKGDIRLLISQQLNGVKYSVQDNGVGLNHKLKDNNSKPHQSIASNLIRKRLDILSLYYNKEFMINIREITSDSGKTLGTSAELTIPSIN